ncbi:reverse transcriptase family protein [Alcanivorax sp. 1008]|uniref:reverse transcriptase family protein n=1 Tax=Alcanivorax sp. 1008 TaxID=2816853 RepID=UPI001D774B30|nr:reverse transcriptase family protein [Alcanivorax sp. 1008]MCC1498314.1 RNA-directed DNA polymerase [Alcanivorax sp. 1008]
MKRRLPKNRIITKKKSYPLQDSPFYKLSSKTRLASLLGSTPKELKSLVGNDNYHCFTQTKKGKPRLIQEPLPHLDKIHSRVASLLCRIETVDGLHSGKKGRSNISNARAHLGPGRKVITADIKSFFPSTTRLMVFDFFYNTMQCSSDVADLLSRILTYDEHIPTGSRISMPLAYIANKRMFDEIEDAAMRVGAKMTIYVDDLTFSGVMLHKDFVKTLEMIAKKHGHRIHPSKTRFYSENAIKLITGAAIGEDRIFPRNRHLKALKEDLQIWINSPQKDRKLINKILGRLTFIGSIDPRYKDKARTFRNVAIK